jgi:hypothetical protein
MGSNPVGDAILTSVASGVIRFRGFFIGDFAWFLLDLDRPQVARFNETCVCQDALIGSLNHDLAVLVNKDLADVFLKLLPDCYRRTLPENFDPLA